MKIVDFNFYLFVLVLYWTVLSVGVPIPDVLGLAELWLGILLMLLGLLDRWLGLSMANL